jgi:predicted ATPase
MPDQAPLLPSPPFSVLLGSIKALAEMYAHAPTDTHIHGVLTMMQRKYKLEGMWFLDSWPASPQRQLVIADPVRTIIPFPV